jgi:CheY-like chemotaxis protein
MFRVLIADDDFEDRELLKLEITSALREDDPDIRFHEAVSVREAVKALTAQIFDLITLDIEFDRMN